MPEWLIPFSGHLIVGMALLGFALVFYIYDRRTPTTRSLSLIFVAIGIGMLLDGPNYAGKLPGARVYWEYLYAVLESIGFLFGIQWVIQVRRGARPAHSLRGIGHWLLRLGQLLVLSGGIMEIILGPLDDLRWDYLFTDKGQFFTLTFWVQALPVLIGLLVVAFVILMMAFSNIDRAERSRIRALMIATPFLASPVLMPPHLNYLTPILVMFGLLIFGGGSVRYVLIQGRRAQMMSRFLTPEVASELKKDGLGGLLRPQMLDITALTCDIRGFTAFAESQESTATLRVLKELYKICGQASARHGGTVKDHAGDGVLILFGAPLPVSDREGRALRAAENILCEVRTLFAENGYGQLGIGAGVANGVASVGVIEGGARVEYAAVGTVVNLSARLCSMARDGQVLISDACYQALGEQDRVGVEKGKRIRVKGLDTAVTVWNLPVTHTSRSLSPVRQRRRWRDRRRRRASASREN